MTLRVPFRFADTDQVDRATASAGDSYVGRHRQPENVTWKSIAVAFATLSATLSMLIIDRRARRRRHRVGR